MWAEITRTVQAGVPAPSAGSGEPVFSSVLAFIATTAYIDCMQYSVRGIAPEIDAALRSRAQSEGKSLNAVALEVLAEGVGLGEAAVVRRDLSDVAGSWRRDTRIEKALADQDAIDEALWR